MYIFWNRYTTRKKALAEAAKLRRTGKRARVEMYAPQNHDVLVDLPNITLASYTRRGK